MRIKEEELEIPIEKITEYLLIVKLKADKSKFLFSQGYTKENWKELLQDILKIALNNDLILQRLSEFGNLYSIKGKLKNRDVITIWFQEKNNNTYRFITLYPAIYD